MSSFLHKIAPKAFVEFVETLGQIYELNKKTWQSIWRRPPSLSSISYEINELGVKSFLIVLVTAIAVGLVMAVQFGYGLQRFGAKLYVPKIVTVSIVRELGPIFTALMLAGRVGAGIAAQIGSMAVTQQIDAMRALGTDPYQKLIAPKIIAMVIAAPLLTVIADMVGIFGGMLIASSELGMSPFDYFFKAFSIINWRDMSGGLIKSVFFGYTIGLFGCYYGMKTRGGTLGVGLNTTQSVVSSSLAIVYLDFVLTKSIWLIEKVFIKG